MNALSQNDEVVPCVRHEQGFPIYILGNQRIEISVVPELGARIISLKNRATGREWMWRPPGPLKLFRNQSGDAFSNSPLAGADECFPTIAPCLWQGRPLPDHGEAWSAAWALDNNAWERGVIRVTVALPISPFVLERSIELRNDNILLDYCLQNRGNADERFLWAWHPLFRLQSGDKLILPDSTRARLNGAVWLDQLDAAIPPENCSKLVAWPITEGCAAIRNGATGDSLAFQWSAAQNPALGLWLNRGGWHGHHHFALEPANGDSDDLSQSAARHCCGLLGAGDSTAWRINLSIAP